MTLTLSCRLTSTQTLLLTLTKLLRTLLHALRFKLDVDHNEQASDDADSQLQD